MTNDLSVATFLVHSSVQILLSALVPQRTLVMECPNDSKIVIAAKRYD